MYIPISYLVSGANCETPMYYPWKLDKGYDAAFCCYPIYEGMRLAA